MTSPALETTAIVAARLGELRDVIKKANNRLAKANITERFKLIVSEPYEHTWTSDTGFRMSERRVDVALEQPTLGYNGWTFVATLVFEEGGTVVRTVPGQECSYRPTTKVCDQCHTDRYRNETFVVRNDETGEYKQVGRNCLALFFGLKPALWVFSYNPMNDFVAEGDDEHLTGGAGGHRDNRVLLADIVLAAMAASNEGRAYKPASFEGETTKGQVNDVLFARHMPVRRESDSAFNAWLDETRRTVETMRQAGVAEQVIEMVKNLKGSSEYAENARVLAHSEYVDAKNIGIVASFAKLWANEKQYEAERKAKAESNAHKVNEFLGQVGEKIAVEGIVTKIREIDGDYGTSRLVEVLTLDGYTVKTFSTAKFVWDLEEGDKLTMTGIVKKYETYSGFKSTVLTRCKAV